MYGTRALFGWSNTRVSSADVKVRSTVCFILHRTTQRYCSIALNLMVTHLGIIHRIKTFISNAYSTVTTVRYIHRLKRLLPTLYRIPHESTAQKLSFKWSKKVTY